MVRSRDLLAVLTAVATTGAAIPAVAQPLDPYDDAPPPIEPTPPDSAVVDERDPELDEAVAAALVTRSRELMAQEAWLDAQQLLNEALIRSPQGAAAAEARVLLEQVNAKLGIVTSTGPQEPIEPVDTVDPYGGNGNVQEVDTEVPGAPADKPRAGRKFIVHAGVMGALIGGFIGDAATADVDPVEIDGDDVNTEDSGGVVGGALLGAIGGLAIGYGFRRSEWMTTDDIAVIDSFAGMGLAGSLSMGALMQPEESEAYSVNAVFGLGGGALVGFLTAKRRDISARRMGRVDLYAFAGAVVPWAIFAASDGDADGAQYAGFFSMVGLAGGAWLGFRTTRDWDRGPAATDAPPALVRRGSDGRWSAGAPGFRAAEDPRLGPVLGKGLAADLVGVRF
jgi:hypothetical protein